MNTQKDLTLVVQDSKNYGSLVDRLCDNITKDVPLEKAGPLSYRSFPSPNALNRSYFSKVKMLALQEECIAKWTQNELLIKRYADSSTKMCLKYFECDSPVIRTAEILRRAGAI